MPRSDDSNYSSWLVIATTIFLIWGLIFAGLRSWTKYKKAFQLNDAFFVSALVIAIAQSTSVYIAASYNYGHTTNANDDSDKLSLQKALYASQLLYVLTVGLSKFSTSQLLCTLARAGWQKKVSIACTALMVPWTVASVFAIALRGNLAAPWLLTYGSTLYTRWLGVEIAGLALEVIMWFVSMYLIWSLQMPIKTRLTVISIFGLRLILLPIVAGRLYFLSRTEDFTTTFANMMSDIFTQGAMQYSLMAECMTSLKPFLQPFHSGYDWSSGDYALSSRMHMGTNPKQASYGASSHLSASRDQDKAPAKVTSDRVLDTERDDLAGRLRYPGGYPQVTSNAPRRKHHSDDDIELLHGPDSRIQQTTTISVYNESLSERS